MTNLFGGFTSSASWLEDFIQSQAAADIKKETVVAWEDDVIRAVKAKRYSGLDEALSDLRQRTGLSETASDDMKSSIMKKVAMDKEWHATHGTSSKELRVLSKTKLNLIQLASDFDLIGKKDVADTIDKVLTELP